MKMMHRKSPPEDEPHTLQLAALPAELHEALTRAVLELDTDRTLALVEEITRRDITIGTVLKKLAESLEYDRLLALFGAGCAMSNLKDQGRGVSMELEIEYTDAEILVVDDIPANLKLLTDILTARGYHVRPAASGQLALRSRGPQTAPYGPAGCKNARYGRLRGVPDPEGRFQQHRCSGHLYQRP